MVLKRPRYLLTRALAHFDARTRLHVGWIRKQKNMALAICCSFRTQLIFNSSAMRIRLSFVFGFVRWLQCSYMRSRSRLSCDIAHNNTSRIQRTEKHKHPQVLFLRPRIFIYSVPLNLMNFNPSPHVGNKRRAKQAANYPSSELESLSLMSSFVTSPLCVHITRGVYRKCAIFCGCVSCHFQK